MGIFDFLDGAMNIVGKGAHVGTYFEAAVGNEDMTDKLNLIENANEGRERMQRALKDGFQAKDLAVLAAPVADQVITTKLEDMGMNPVLAVALGDAASGLMKAFLDNKIMPAEKVDQHPTVAATTPQSRGAGPAHAK